MSTSIIREKKEESKAESGAEGKLQTREAVTISIAHAMHDTYAGFIAPLLPLLIARLSLLKVEAGLFSFFYQGTSVLQPFIGHTADRKNLRKLALLGPAVTGIMLSLLGVAPDFYTGLLFSMVAGISSAFMHAVLPPLVTSFSGKEIGKGMSIWLVGGEIGILLGPILITFIVSVFSINATPWLMLGGIMVSIILNILLKDIPGINGKNSTTTFSVPKKELVHLMLPIGALVLMRSFLRASAEVFLPVYLTESGASLIFVGASTSILFGSGIIGTILGGALNDRTGHRAVLAFSILFSTISMLLFIHSDGFLQIISLAFLGFTSIMMLPVGMALAQATFPFNRSLANGTYLALFFAINAIASVITGYIYDQLGGYQTFLIGALINLLGLLFVLFLPKKVSPVIPQNIDGKERT